MVKEFLRLFFVLILTISVSACSSSSKKIEGEETDEALSMEDSELPEADEVGSVSEDSQDDPFADLDVTETGDADASMANMESESESAPVEEASSLTGNMKTYTSGSGETLMQVAFSIYGDVSRWRDLAKWNKDVLPNPHALGSGVSLKYDAPDVPFNRTEYSNSYLIQKGDTLGGIAKTVYGRVSKWKKLQNYNRRLIRDPNLIFAGFTLYYDITDEERKEAAAKLSRRTKRLPAKVVKRKVASDNLDAEFAELEGADSGSDTKESVIVQAPQELPEADVVPVNVNSAPALATRK